MTDVGCELREAREGRGLLLRDIAARTKIREALLMAMERNDFSRLPTGLLARGYFRAYAAEVGLDPESTVRKYVERVAEQAPLAPMSNAEPPMREPRGPRAARRVAGATVVMVAAAAMFVLLPTTPIRWRGSSTSSPEPASVATTGREVPAVSESRLPAVAAVDAATKTVTAAPSELTIEIRPRRVVWVQALADGRRVLYALVQPGESRVLQAQQQMLLRVGDAGAFDYLVNGAPGRRIGRPGEVRSVRITTDNLHDFAAR